MTFNPELSIDGHAPVWVQVAIGLMLMLAVSVEAQPYKCKKSDGGTIYQQVPCTPVDVRPKADMKQKAPRMTADDEERLKNLVTKCASMKIESAEYPTCISELSCMEDGIRGPGLPGCVSERQSVFRREVDTALAAERSRRAQSEPSSKPAPLAQRPSQPADEPVECWKLSKYSRAQGHDFFEVAMIVSNARKEGLCR